MKWLVMQNGERVAASDCEATRLLRSENCIIQRAAKVIWALWRETLRLLKTERSKEGELVLLDESGRPLRTETLENRQIKKNDNVRSVFSRLCRKLKITDGEFKRFRKTSASLLREK